METIENATVLVVDDHPIFRRGLCDVIKEKSHFIIVGEASDGNEALVQLDCFKPDIAILDVDMPNLNGLRTMRAIQDRPFQVKVVVLTMYREEKIFNAAMDLGAKAFVLKENASNDLITALEQVSQGGMFFSNVMVEAGKRRSDRVRDLLICKPQIESLTPAERRILKLIAEDLTTKEIASRLQLSDRTVENHRYHICQKLNLYGAHSLLKFAFDNSAYL